MAIDDSTLDTLLLFSCLNDKCNFNFKYLFSSARSGVLYFAKPVINYYKYSYFKSL